MMVDCDSSPDHTPSRESDSSEVRAILWGRLGRRLEEGTNETPSISEQTAPTSGTARPPSIKRPTRLSDEWNELRRLRGSPDGQDNVSIPSHRMESRRSIWKNFISLCTSLMCAFISFLPLRNIQSSLYTNYHLGTLSLAVIYGSFIIGCVMSSWIAQNARPKGLILVSVFSHVLFVAANMFPSFITLIPTSCLFGFLQAPLWSVQELLIGSYGTSYSAVTGMRMERSIQQFQGVFVIFCHSAQIFGNLLESLVLGMDDITTNTMFHGNYSSYLREESLANNCTSPCQTAMTYSYHVFGYEIFPNTMLLDGRLHQVEILKIIFLAIGCVSVTLVGLCLRKPDIILNKRKMCLKEKVQESLSFFKTKTFLMLGLLMIFTGMQQGIVINDVTKVYGTNGLGLSMVGYFMMCYGTCQLATLLVLERFQKRVKPIIFVLKGFLISLGLLILLYVWEPVDDCVYTVLGYMALWGAVDAVWQSQVQNILVSNVTRKEPAIIGFRICQGFGLTVVFLASIWLSLLYKLCLVCGILIMGVLGYMILEINNNPMTPLEPRPFSV
ncbi:protein unc-93 homolog A-like [Ylistrum balloti]|uniref:protein unc-93 homolog A-like n=1 Tax=Ylistrum balloti TaxID=509963 RepID=UPI002905F46B|nr:protein unc-93 homolog A-like [Ylistrum balloti]